MTLAPLALLSLAAALQAQDPVRVSATLTPATVRTGETAILEVTVDTRGPTPDAITIPPLPDGLDLVGSSDFTRLQLTLPGGRRRTVRRQLTLAARAPGRYEIPPVTVRVSGEEYRTGAVTLVVTGAAPTPRTRSRGPNDEVILRAWLAPDTAYVGQQVTLHGEAMFSNEVRLQLRRAPDYIPPSPSGFWVHDLAGSPTIRRRVVGDELYEVQTFGRAYFPLGPGEYTLAPARLLYEVRRGFLFAPENHELATDSLRLVVLPLPEAGRPASFTGAVGRYRIRASIEPAEVPAGGAAALLIEVEGEGNVKALPPPAIPELEGARVFSASEEADLEQGGDALRGVKRFTWVLIPERPGRLQLPPLEYAYFDPERGAYGVARSSVPPLEVRRGAGAVTAGSAGAGVAVVRAEPSGPPPLRWVRSPWFAGLPFLPLAGLAWTLARWRAARRTGVPTRRRLRAQRRQRFAELESLAAGTDAGFFARLAAAVRLSLAERLASPDLERASAEDVRRLLEDRGVVTGLAGHLSRLLVRVERARFEPEPPGHQVRRAYLAEAVRLLDAVDGSADARAGGASAAGTVAGTVVAWVLVAAVPGHAAARQDEGGFAAAVQAYAAGDFAAAARGFRGFLEASPEDANAWYNLGGAYYGAGDRGRAIWAWLRAGQLRPRDAQVRRNLTVAQAGQELVRQALPPVPLSTEETLFGACLLWLAGCAALGWAFPRHRRAAAGAGAILVSLALALVVAWLVPRLGPPIAVVLDGPAPLLAAPVLRAEPLRSLAAGAGVRVLEARPGWLRVATFDGGQGWLEAERAGGL